MIKPKKNIVIISCVIFLIFISIFTIFIYNTNNPFRKVAGPSTNENSNETYYSSLHGTWSITKHIPSKMKTSLSDSIISFCIGQEFTIDEDKITSLFATIYNPTIEEGIITALDFSNKYNDTFENLGIPGEELKFIKITETDENKHSVTILIANDGKVYALLSGALFELEKQM